MKLKQKHVDASRELRLWIVQVIVPTMIFMTAYPEARMWVVDKFNNGKSKIKEKLNVNK